MPWWRTSWPPPPTGFWSATLNEMARRPAYPALLCRLRRRDRGIQPARADCRIAAAAPAAPVAADHRQRPHHRLVQSGVRCESGGVGARAYSVNAVCGAQQPSVGVGDVLPAAPVLSRVDDTEARTVAHSFLWLGSGHDPAYRH